MKLEVAGAEGASWTVPPAPTVSARMVTVIGLSMTDAAQCVPGRGVERVGRAGGEDAERVGEPGHREIDLEQVLAGGGVELEARPQPVARHQRPGDGRGDAGGAVAARGAAVEQRGGVRRRRRVDDRCGGEVGERWRGRTGGAARATGRATGGAGRPAPPCRRARSRFRHRFHRCRGLERPSGTGGEPAPDGHQAESDDRRGDRQPRDSSHVGSHVGSTVAARRQTYAA